MAATTAPGELDVGRKWPAILLIGALTGLLSGLLGIGGAAILVPGMVDVLGMSQHRATGTSLFVIIPTAFVSAIIYLLNGQLDWPLVILFSVTAVVGATLGARVTGKISALNLRRMFGVFLLFVAIRLLIPGGTGDPGRPFEVDLTTQSAAMSGGEAVLGLIAGFLSGLLGIGGGQVLTPGMVFLFDFPQKLAQGISIAFIVPTAISGALTHYRRGNVETRAGTLLMPASIVGGVAGSWLAQIANPQNLRMGFGVFLIYASVRMLAPRLLTGALRRLGGSRA
jgi:uncharacterized membrane protein YfcA